MVREERVRSRIGQGSQSPEDLPASDLLCDHFSIRAAQTHRSRLDARGLVTRMYTRRGYCTEFVSGTKHGQVTLVARTHPGDNAVGTITLGLDGEAGLLADRLYAMEVQRLRSTGKRICEFVKLAAEPSRHSKRLIATLFHVAFIYARRLYLATDLIIEVTPQHARFYKHMLHFETIGEERLNPRVNTRGLLLRLDLEHAAEQIRLFGGQGASSSSRTLYPYAMPSDEEQMIYAHIQTFQPVALIAA